MRRILFFITATIISVAIGHAIDPTATTYSNDCCQGSLRPYPAPQQTVAYPDSLTPVFINHVGRHGSRYPASATHCTMMKLALEAADSLGTITPLGRTMLRYTDLAIERSRGQWGALDSLGMAEQRGIASRMYARYQSVFKGANIKAISSYSPRSIMSMNSFTHQLTRHDNRIELTATSGRSTSPLMRPFDVDPEYQQFSQEAAYKQPYDQYIAKAIPLEPLRRILGTDYPLSEKESESLALAQYYVIAGMSAMMIDCDASQFFSTDEYNRLWSCFSLRQYLQRTSTTISTIPADIASPLLLDIISTTDAAANGTIGEKAILRFGHAETLMPLLSLMRLNGCCYKTNYFDTVAKHWKDFDVVPMSANLQIILFSTDNGKHYVRIDRNEQPIALLPNDNSIYIPWEKARDYLMRCVPIYYQP